MKKLPLILTLVSALTGAASAATVFRDQMINAAAWTVNGQGGGRAATFNYNYSTDLIPEAPNSLPGDAATRAVKLEANTGPTPTLTTLILAPTGQSFSGDHTLRFDAWMNFGTNSTTEFLGGMLGYNGSATDIGIGTSAAALATGDGGSASDWRTFAGGTFIPEGEMPAGSRNGSDLYYSSFLPVVNNSVAGSPGLQWVTWEFSSIGDTFSVTIERPDKARLLIDSYLISAYAGLSTSGNIGLMYADFFTSVTTQPELTFGLIDNVIVTAVPEPGLTSLTLLATLGFAFRRRQM